MPPVDGHSDLVRIVFAGTPEAAVPSLRALHASNHEIVAVLTRPPAPKGRGRQVEPSPVAAVAEELQLRILAPARLSNPEFVSELGSLRPQCCPVVAYGSLVTPELLRVPEFGWVNLHFSLLPAWRGAAPVQHAILHGDDITGATTFQLDEGLDTGPILGQLTERISQEDTAGDLLGRLSASGAKLLVQTMDAVADGSVRAEPQPIEGISFAPKLSVDDARVNWDVAALNVNRLIRACHPSPGAWTTHNELRLKLLGSTVVTGSDVTDSDVTDLAPGQVRVQKNDVTVGCGISAVRLETVQPQGKRPMAAADWVRGLRNADGLTLR